jgi:outer membrane protein assembly factor BamB
MNRRLFLSSITSSFITATGCLGQWRDEQRESVGEVKCVDKTDSSKSEKTVSSVTGDWPSPQFDAQNTAFNPDASGFRECPEKRWQFRVNVEEPRNVVNYGVQSPPVLHDGTLFVCDNENELYAVDATTGEITWTAGLPGWFIYGPTYADGVLYLTADRHLQAISVQSRSERWRRTPPSPNGRTEKDDQAWMPAAPAVYDGRIYVGTANGIFCTFEADSGELVWFQSIPERRPPQDDGTSGFNESNVFSGQPAVTEDVVCVSNKNGRLYAFDTESGDRRWVFRAKDRLDTAPVIYGNLVHVTGASGIYAVSLSTGELVWSYKTRDSFTSAAPAIANDVLITVAGDDFPNRNLVALNATTGDLLWELPAFIGLEANPSIADGTVVVGIEHGVLAVRLDSGERLWRIRSEQLPGAPVLVDGTVFVGDSDGYVYAIR